MPETNEPGLDHMMAALRDQASGVRGSFDAGALAAAGRRRAERRRLALGGALAGVLVMVLGGGAWGLATWADRSPVQTVADSPSPSAAPTTQIGPVEVAVDTSGWPTYSSPEYPVTFQYPPDWTVAADRYSGALAQFDGCTTDFCLLYVSPPSSDGAALELIRNGFPDSLTAGSSVPLPTDVEVLGSVPGLIGWSLDAPEPDEPRQVVVVRSEEEGEVNYSLTVTGSTVSGLALGDQNPLPDRTEAAFSFSTNAMYTNSVSDGEAASTLIAILASIRPNPDFAPTPLVDDGTGRKILAAFDTMSTPTVGAVTPDSSWKTYTSAAGNVTLRYPASWKVQDISGNNDGAEIVAPSGYGVDLLLMGAEESHAIGDGRWCDEDRGLSQVLGTVDQAQAESEGGAGPAEVRWVNGGERAAWTGLTHSAGSGCYVSGLNYGGTSDVYLMSSDHWDNPSAEELDQAVAILASVRRAG